MNQPMIITEQAIWDRLDQVPDPEVPAISIVELGVVRKIEITDDGVYIAMTPTYSGCPALKEMEDQVRDRLKKEGVENIVIDIIYKPAWTTDWLSEPTRQKLKDYGIAPPGMLPKVDALNEMRLTDPACPYCNSTETKMTSFFGSTACKSLHFCNSCNQPFEHFKCH